MPIIGAQRTSRTSDPADDALQNMRFTMDPLLAPREELEQMRKRMASADRLLDPARQNQLGAAATQKKRDQQLGEMAELRTGGVKAPSGQVGLFHHPDLKYNFDPASDHKSFLRNGYDGAKGVVKEKWTEAKEFGKNFTSVGGLKENAKTVGKEALNQVVSQVPFADAARTGVGAVAATKNAIDAHRIKDDVHSDVGKNLAANLQAQHTRTAAWKGANTAVGLGIDALSMGGIKPPMVGTAASAVLGVGEWAHGKLVDKKSSSLRQEAVRHGETTENRSALVRQDPNLSRAMLDLLKPGQKHFGFDEMNMASFQNPGVAEGAQTLRPSAVKAFANPEHQRMKAREELGVAPHQSLQGSRPEGPGVLDRAKNLFRRNQTPAPAPAPPLPAGVPVPPPLPGNATTPSNPWKSHLGQMIGLQEKADKKKWLHGD